MSPLAPRAALGRARTWWQESVIPRLKRVTWSRRRTVIAGAAGLAIVVGGASVAWAGGADPSSYRTATASTGAIEEELDLIGTIESANRRDASFGVGGEVSAVNVSLGDTVEAGDVLATLDTIDLEEAVEAAEERVASAEEALASDLEAQSSATEEDDEDTSSETTTSTASAPSGAGDSSADPALEAAVRDVQNAQEQLLALIEAASESLTAAEATVTDATELCQPFLDAELEGADDSEAAPAADAVSGEESEFAAADDEAEESDEESEPLTLEAVQELLVTCQEAITGVADAQAVTQAAQEAVAAAMTELDAAITALQDAVAASTTTSSTPSDTSSGSSTTSPSTASASGGGTSSVPSAADIVADYAAIEVAEANVLIAEQSLAAAELTAPIDGTVALVAFEVGDTVDANSTTAVITILGDDGYLIETTVTLAEVQKVAVGQVAEVTISSSGEHYPATVSAVGFVNVATDSATPSYAITISIDAGDAVLLNGAAAQVAVSVATADGVVVIPISALHRSDAGDTVSVLDGGELVTVPVEVGAIGTDLVEIISGIAVGDEVVIADLTAATEEATAETTGLADLGGTTEETGAEFGGTPPDFGGGPPAGAGGR